MLLLKPSSFYTPNHKDLKPNVKTNQNHFRVAELIRIVAKFETWRKNYFQVIIHL